MKTEHNDEIPLTTATLHLLTLAADEQMLALHSPVPVVFQSMTTVVLADDHPGVRQKLKELLEREKNVQIVGVAADGLQALQLVSDLHPDVLVTDLMMPHLNGFEVISYVRLALPKTRIVVVSVQTDKPYVQEIFRRGANAYVQKDASGDHLVEALRCVLAGRQFLSPPATSDWLAEVQPGPTDGTLDLLETLTDQQRRLLQMAAGGQTDSEIAGELLLNPATVGQIRAGLMKKFGLRSPAELEHFAKQKGLEPECGDV
jgi:DNA-binding NarL/FixJ family response regulator